MALGLLVCVFLLKICLKNIENYFLFVFFVELSGSVTVFEVVSVVVFSMS